MLLLGALTNTNPVVDGFGVFDLSLANFVTVLGNPNDHGALANSLIACTGGTALAVVIGLAFSWIVVRTNTPWRGFVAAASLIPLFVPPLVAGVAWSILGSPRSGLINTMLAWARLARAVGAGRARGPQLHDRCRQRIPAARRRVRIVALAHVGVGATLSFHRRRAARPRFDRGRVPPVPIHPHGRQPVRDATLLASAFRGRVR